MVSHRLQAAAHRWQHDKKGEVLVWETTHGDLRARHSDSSTGFFSVAISPDGVGLVGAGTDGTLRVWQLDQQNIRAAR